MFKFSLLTAMLTLSAGALVCRAASEGDTGGRVPVLLELHL
jgi:hypothetical protein